MRRLLSLSEAAQRVGRTEKAIRQLIFRKKFPFTKVSGNIGVEEEELEKFLKISQRVTAEEAAAEKRMAA
jgi:hypothetical protein